MSGMSGHLPQIKRLLREAFSDILNLKDRLAVLETNSEESTKSRPFKGSLLLSNEPVNKAGVYNPQWRLRIQFPLAEKFNTKIEVAPTSDVALAKLTKVIHQADFFDGGLKFTYASTGGTGDDIVPSLNPNANQGLSQFVSKGCPIHQKCEGPAIGLNIGNKTGSRVCAGLFVDESGESKREVVLAGVSHSPFPNSSLGVVGTFPLAIGNSQRTNIFKGMADIGLHGVINIDEHTLVTGWMCAERQPSHKYVLRSHGLVLSSIPRPNSSNIRLGISSSTVRGVWQQAFEISTTRPTINDGNICFGIKTTIRDGKLCPLFGIQNEITF